MLSQPTFLFNFSAYKSHIWTKKTRNKMHIPKKEHDWLRQKTMWKEKTGINKKKVNFIASISWTGKTLW